MQGVVYLEKLRIIEPNSPVDLAKFLHGAERIDREQERRLLVKRPDVLDKYSFRIRDFLETDAVFCEH